MAEGAAKLTAKEEALTREHDRVRGIVEKEWSNFLATDRQLTPKQLNYARDIIEALFVALHYNTSWNDVAEAERPRSYWQHQQFDPFRTNDASRGIAIEKAPMLQAAAQYLARPDIRTDRLDWLFLDAIVFAELDAYADHVIRTRGGTGFNWASIFTRNPGKRIGLSFLFWIIGVLFGYVLPLGLVYYLYSNGHATSATVLLAVWALLLVWRVLTFPLRWRARRKAQKLLQHLLDLYTRLGDSTISPTAWKKMLEAATAEGVVLDGAVYTIIDRAIARDPTAFIP